MKRCGDGVGGRGAETELCFQYRLRYLQRVQRQSNLGGATCKTRRTVPGAKISSCATCSTRNSDPWHMRHPQLDEDVAASSRLPGVSDMSHCVPIIMETTSDISNLTMQVLKATLRGKKQDYMNESREHTHIPFLSGTVF